MSLSFTVKLLVFCSILILYLLSLTSGLKCYGCHDLIEGQSCKIPNITVCGVDSHEVKESQIGAKASLEGTMEGRLVK